MVTLFEQKLARRNGHAMTLGSFGFVGMMEWDLESMYDLQSMTLGNTDSESNFKGSYHPLRECNMLHLSEDGVVVAGGTEDDTYLIPRTPEEQAEYDQERLERARARKAEQQLDAEGVRAWACCLYDQI